MTPGIDFVLSSSRVKQKIKSIEDDKKIQEIRMLAKKPEPPIIDHHNITIGDLKFLPIYQREQVLLSEPREPKLLNLLTKINSYQVKKELYKF